MYMTTIPASRPASKEEEQYLQDTLAEYVSKKVKVQTVSIPLPGYGLATQNFIVFQAPSKDLLADAVYHIGGGLMDYDDIELVH